MSGATGSTGTFVSRNRFRVGASLRLRIGNEAWRSVANALNMNQAQHASEVMRIMSTHPSSVASWGRHDLAVMTGNRIKYG